MKAAELSRIVVKLEEIEKKSSQERQQLLAMLASSQKVCHITIFTTFTMF